MRLLLAYAYISLSYTMRFCEILQEKHLNTFGNCTHLVLNPFQETMNDPRLYDAIKKVERMYVFHLNNTNLTRISEAPKVTLPKDAEIFIVNNRRLKTLPNFEIENGKRLRLFIQDNPRLNTTQLLQECKRKRCPPRIVNSIQMPFCKL
ncbi:hypothetical protein Y032_0534g3065 [Ancylostoma ceylanicum]|uniref:Receptor L-domain domain-containing protein n=1 Tax=Ancylostoma ceylanicum TaxID=53326 RepID=A0A016WTI1_9BILA|nr:hypothetical protein Y032_0534g3065 [Ancylostoma ceylanicum]